MNASKVSNRFETSVPRSPAQAIIGTNTLVGSRQGEPVLGSTPFAEQFLHCDPKGALLRVRVFSQTQLTGFGACRLVAQLLCGPEVKVPQAPRQAAIAVVKEEGKVIPISKGGAELLYHGSRHGLGTSLETEIMKTAFLHFAAVGAVVLAWCSQVEHRAVAVRFQPVETVQEGFESGCHLVLGHGELRNAHGQDRRGGHGSLSRLCRLHGPRFAVYIELGR